MSNDWTPGGVREVPVVYRYEIELRRAGASGSFPRLERKWFHVAEDKRDSFGVVYIPRSLKWKQVRR